VISAKDQRNRLIKQFIKDAIVIFAVVAAIVLIWLAVDVLPYKSPGTPD